MLKFACVWTKAIPSVSVLTSCTTGTSCRLKRSGRPQPISRDGVASMVFYSSLFLKIAARTACHGSGTPQSNLLLVTMPSGTSAPI